MSAWPVKLFLLAGLLAAMQAAPAAGESAPFWRGWSGSTYQVWGFNNDANPAPPESWANIYGTPLANVFVAETGTGWWEQLEGMGTQTGYWDLGGEGGLIAIEVPQDTSSQGHLDVVVQVVYLTDISRPPHVEVLGGTCTLRETFIVEHLFITGDWVLERSTWEVVPPANPERLTVVADAGRGSVVDAVAVDTIAWKVPAVCHIPPQDIDGGGSVNDEDWFRFQACALGPATPWPAGNPDCACFDVDGDTDVDLDDFGAFQRCYNPRGSVTDGSCTP